MLQVVSLVPRQSAVYQPIQNHTDRPNIALYAVWFLAQHLRGHVNGCSDTCPLKGRVLETICFNEFGEPKIRYFDLPSMDQDVIRF